jgi:hypothetical protein
MYLYATTDQRKSLTRQGINLWVNPTVILNYKHINIKSVSHLGGADHLERWHWPWIVWPYLSGPKWITLTESSILISFIEHSFFYWRMYVYPLSDYKGMQFQHYGATFHAKYVTGWTATFHTHGLTWIIYKRAVGVWSSAYHVWSESRFFLTGLHQRNHL